jgi:hypothetical protein
MIPLIAKMILGTTNYKRDSPKVKNFLHFCRMRTRPPLPRLCCSAARVRRFWCFGNLIFLASLISAGAAEHAAVFGNDALSLNDVVVGAVTDTRAELSLPKFVQILGTPSRSAVDGQTQRITWDNDGIQLEATNPGTTPFAVLFNCTAPDAVSRGIIPNGPFLGTFDSPGIKLRLGQTLPDRAKILTAAGFAKEPTSPEAWSLRLAHWAVYLRFTGAVLDAVIIRVLPDIY